MNKSFHFQIKNTPCTLTLTPPPQWGRCFGCFTEQSIRIIINSPEKKEFCPECSLKKMETLTKYDFKDKERILETVRCFLLTGKILENYG